MERYDPLKAPDPNEWHLLDEQERLDLVEDYHRLVRVDLPNAKAHAIAHVVVENQAALGDELAVERTLTRLMVEGLDRHDAVHAIGSVFLELLHDTMRNAKSHTFPNEEYAVALERLTAEAWLRSADETMTEEDLEPKEDLEPEEDLSPNIPAVNPFKDVGRNDPCPCGSGKKFKRCCLK